MDLNLGGKIALIAGATGGIGKAIAVGLAQEHVRLVLCSRREDLLKTVAKDIESISGSTVIPVSADLSRPKNIKTVVNQALETFGRVDILINSFASPTFGGISNPL